jgi:hypothetical protein
MTRAEVLNTLDNYNVNQYRSFFTLNHPYTYTIDSRLNIFTGPQHEWAIVSEVLGYEPRADCITLDLTYLGNCLINLEQVNDLTSNHRTVIPVDPDQFRETLDGDALKPEATGWLVRGEMIPVSQNRKEYAENGIELEEFEPGEIRAEEAGRLLILKYARLFRATDEELYQSLPATLRKILVLDEWYHREYYLQMNLLENPEFQRRYEMMPEPLRQMLHEDMIKRNEFDRIEREQNRPGSYETWQQLADVITTGDVSLYKPTLKPNSHWKNWPESGSL